ncbi:MAG: hypothetical protein K0U72_15160 [Gammaproteobacteria bacterium]|nr:hypothetical protein [Gammaproteobacteria bacterium]
MKISIKWLLVGYVAAILVCVGWKARYAFAGSGSSSASVFEAVAVTNGDSTGHDKQIIEDALQLLTSVPNWTQNDDEFCVPGRPLTLYCALAISAKANGRNLSPADNVIARVNDTILAMAANPDDYPSPATKPFAVILAFNNHASSDRDSVIDILAQSLTDVEPR